MGNAMSSAVARKVLKDVAICYRGMAPPSDKRSMTSTTKPAPATMSCPLSEQKFMCSYLQCAGKPTSALSDVYRRTKRSS